MNGGRSVVGTAEAADIFDDGLLTSERLGELVEGAVGTRVECFPLL